MDIAKGNTAATENEREREKEGQEEINHHSHSNSVVCAIETLLKVR